MVSRSLCQPGGDSPGFHGFPLVQSVSPQVGVDEVAHQGRSWSNFRVQGSALELSQEAAAGLDLAGEGEVGHPLKRHRIRVARVTGMAFIPLLEQIGGKQGGLLSPR